jgi:hypothetical protein
MSIDRRIFICLTKVRSGSELVSKPHSEALNMSYHTF